MTPEEKITDYYNRKGHVQGKKIGPDGPRLPQGTGQRDYNSIPRDKTYILKNSAKNI